MAKLQSPCKMGLKNLRFMFIKIGCMLEEWGFLDFKVVRYSYRQLTYTHSEKQTVDTDITPLRSEGFSLSFELFYG